ncbi:Stk1 family PASTA domain-containing Ser/Thr kinase [Solibacillus sp. CAU 1738]|uniref:Stk1 family PASTA domain-containing Ser/Thr kinase n=1 Tax=Solibacillus sp. CAU 1738 TaxID=3140363 RepID=UPI003260CA3A
MIIGKRISDRYKIIALIGGGGMSNVYLAHDMILNRDVAIKILRYDFTNEEELHRRFQREALSATSLTHPNIVSIYDVGEDGNMHYIVMEYIEGKTLKQYIQEFSPLSPARSVHIMKQLTSAIAHAHENGIIHRDIKPQNILVDLDGNVKITDFGIATTLSATSYTQTNSVMGTVHYLSPEQARGGTATNKSDVYSLGIVFYELLTGELPFSGESAVAIALKHLQAETPSVRAFDGSIPQSVENVVLKATAKDPNHRYQTAEEMEMDLASALSANRVNEAKFAPQLDDGATKVMPIIKDKKAVHDLAETKKIDTVKKQPKQPVQQSANNKKKKKWPLVLGILLALVAVIVIVAIVLTPSKNEVPAVTNYTIEEAEIALKKAGFVVGQIDERYNEEIEEGKVIETDPKAGLMRVKGTEINLIVSLGNETSVMDDYVGSSITQIRPMLAPLFADIIEEEVYDDLPAGTIIRQEPAAGEEIVVKNTTIRFTVSKGKHYEKVDDLIGYTPSQISEYANNKGFVLKEVQKVPSETIAVGGVVSHNPKKGDLLEVGGTLEITVSSGPRAKPVKLYTKLVEIPYMPLEEGAKQVVRIFIQDKNHTMAEPVEEIAITETTSYRIELTISEGEIGAYRIERDAVVIDEKTINYDDL